jgi:hypothetical protein
LRFVEESLTARQALARSRGGTMFTPACFICSGGRRGTHAVSGAPIRSMAPPTASDEGIGPGIEVVLRNGWCRGFQTAWLWRGWCCWQMRWKDAYT